MATIVKEVSHGRPRRTPTACVRVTPRNSSLKPSGYSSLVTTSASGHGTRQDQRSLTTSSYRTPAQVERVARCLINLSEKPGLAHPGPFNSKVDKSHANSQGKSRRPCTGFNTPALRRDCAAQRTSYCQV